MGLHSPTSKRVLDNGEMPRSPRTYDHRLRELVRQTGDISLATRIGVPRSTAAGWLRGPPRPTVTLDVLSMTEQELQAEVHRLRRQLEKLRATARILFACLRALDIDLSRGRVPDGNAKSTLLKALKRGTEVLTSSKALAIIGLSQSRFHAWKRAELRCDLDDHSSCPKTSPHRVTPREVGVIREMVTSPEYRHVPTGTLALLAQRLGRVFASATTWHRLVREREWRRPRVRVHPAKPKVGIRAGKPNEVWHIDMSLIRLVDGTKAYLHAVIDNYSRRILSWRVGASFDPGNTLAVLLEASKSSGRETPMVLADGGVENVNRSVDELIESGVLRRVLAMTDLCFSNSMIEAWWRVLKHQWLFLNTLDSVTTVEKLVKFYVAEHNERLPHSAFRGQTPDEMYFGKGDGVPDGLESAREAARNERLAVNRSLSCAVCEASQDSDAA